MPADSQLSTSIGVQFGEGYADVPGILYTLLQRVALQNVNLIEISSTYAEIAFYGDEADARTRSIRSRSGADIERERPATGSMGSQSTRTTR